MECAAELTARSEVAAAWEAGVMGRKRSAAARAKTRPLRRGLCFDDSKRGGLVVQTELRTRRFFRPLKRALIANLRWPRSENCFDTRLWSHLASGHRRSLIPRGNSERPEVARCG